MYCYSSTQNNTIKSNYVANFAVIMLHDVIVITLTILNGIKEILHQEFRSSTETSEQE